MTKPKEKLTATADEQHDQIQKVETLVREAIGQSGVMLYVARKGEDGRERHVMKCTPDIFDIDEIGRVYGGGEFRVRIRNPDNTWGTGAAFGIEGEPIHNPRAGQPAGQLATEPRSGGREDFMERALIALLQTRSQPASVAPAFDPVAFATALASATAAGMTQASAAMKSAIELAGIKETAAPPDSVERTLELLKFGMDLAERRPSGDGEGGNWMGQVAAAITNLAQLAQKQKDTAAAGTAVQPTGPQLVTETPTVSPLAQAIELLLPVAGDMDVVESWAEIAASRIPMLDEALITALQQAGSVAALLDFAELRDARIKPHRNFFAHVIEYLTAEDDESGETDGADKVET